MWRKPSIIARLIVDYSDETKWKSVLQISRLAAMNLSRANTEAFYKLYRFHEYLNRTIKLVQLAYVSWKTP